jgi:hypothetical protein
MSHGNLTVVTQRGQILQISFSPVYYSIFFKKEQNRKKNHPEIAVLMSYHTRRIILPSLFPFFSSVKETCLQHTIGLHSLAKYLNFVISLSLVPVTIFVSCKIFINSSLALQDLKDHYSHRRFWYCPSYNKLAQWQCNLVH